MYLSYLIVRPLSSQKSLAASDASLLDQAFQAILSCREEELQAVVSQLPCRIERRLVMTDMAGAPQVGIIQVPGI